MFDDPERNLLLIALPNALSPGLPGQEKRSVTRRW